MYRHFIGYQSYCTLISVYVSIDADRLIVAIYFDSATNYIEDTR
jgi:hypothetical protein